MKKVSKEKIQKTEWEFVPLDKMIPLKTAVNIFNREYKKKRGSDYFKRDSQRLREIYFSLFACKALDIIEKKEHFLCFHKRQDFNDISFISVDSKKENGNIQYYDVKEYINNKDDINIFLSNVFKKAKHKNYNLIVGIHKNGRLALDLGSMEKSVFFVSNIDEQSEDNYKALVRLVSQKKVVFDEIIDLSVFVDDESSDIIYHDRLNFRIWKIGGVQYNWYANQKLKKGKLKIQASLFAVRSRKLKKHLKTFF